MAKRKAVMISTQKVIRMPTMRKKSRRSAAGLSTVSASKLRLINTIGTTPVTRAGEEIKSAYLTVSGELGGINAAPVSAEGANTSSQRLHITQISEGSGSDNRVGRLLKLRQYVFRWAVQAPESGAGAAVRMVVIFDKRPERSQTLAFDDMFVYAGATPISINAINALPRESLDGRFEYLFDKTVHVYGSHPVQRAEDVDDGDDKVGYESTGNLRSGMEVIDLTAKKYFTQYVSTGISGSESDVEYGCMHFLWWSNVTDTSDTGIGSSAQQPRFHAFSELTWTG